MVRQIKSQFDKIRTESTDLYQCLNHFRDWVNGSLVNYEIFLEDNWYEDKTVIEYTVRCLDTFNVMVVAQDEYKNHRQNGVWNLGEYIQTYWTVDDPWEKIEAFMKENKPPRLKGEGVSDEDAEE